MIVRFFVLIDSIVPFKAQSYDECIGQVAQIRNRAPVEGDASHGLLAKQLFFFSPPLLAIESQYPLQTATRAHRTCQLQTERETLGTFIKQKQETIIHPTIRFTYA